MHRNVLTIGDRVPDVAPDAWIAAPRSLVAGVPAKVRRDLHEDELEHLRTNAEVYRGLTVQHRALGALTAATG